MRNIINNSVQINLNDLKIDVFFKPIKNINLSVYSPKGRVRVSAPKSITIETIRIFIVSKLKWIKKQQQKLHAQAYETPRKYIDRESHYFKGKCYLLKIVECDAPPQVNLSHSQMVLQVRSGSNKVKKRSILNEWYRQQLKQKLNTLIPQWERKMNVSVTRWTIRKMKTKWGSCTPIYRSIRINLELTKRPPECLEYVVVHELAHLLEPSHNSRFKTLMDLFMPKWRMYRNELNCLPVLHKD